MTILNWNESLRRLVDMKITNEIVYDANPQLLIDKKRRERIKAQEEEDKRNKRKQAKRRNWEKFSISAMMFSQMMRNSRR